MIQNEIKQIETTFGLFRLRMIAPIGMITPTIYGICCTKKCNEICKRQTLVLIPL